MAFEYKVIPAPRRGRRGKGIKGAPGRFAYAIEVAINEMAEDGWDFVRAETLGADEREGMMRRLTETFHAVLVFRREKAAAPTPTSPILTEAKPEVTSAAPEAVAPKKLVAEPKAPVAEKPVTKPKVTKKAATEVQKPQASSEDK